MVSALELGANVDCRYYNAPLHRAAGFGHMECIKALLDRGAEVNIKCNADSTPLHSAAWGGHVDCTRALLDSGAEVNTQDCHGSTPLHSAAFYGRVECMKALLDSGAEVDAQDNDGSTPLHNAARLGHVECIKDLIGSGARVTIINNRGQTALDLALQEGHQDCANAIRSHSRRRYGDDQQGGDQAPAQNSSVNQLTEIDKLRAQLAEARAKIDKYEVYRACMTGKEEVITSQDLATLESLLATLDLECLRKAVLEKRVQREVDKARNIATECGICLSAPKDTCLHPCGHMVCRSCSDLIQLCPICRQTIAERKRVFL